MLENPDSKTIHQSSFFNEKLAEAIEREKSELENENIINSQTGKDQFCMKMLERLVKAEEKQADELARIRRLLERRR